MEVAQTNDVLYLDAYAATHRRALRAVEKRLLVITGLCCFMFALWSFWTLRQQHIWRTYHNEAMAAMNAALDGDTKASLPTDSNLNYKLAGIYFDLFVNAKYQGDQFKTRKAQVSEHLTKLERIALQFGKQDFQSLERSYSEIERHMLDIAGMQHIYTNIDSDLSILQTEWDSIWPGNDLEYKLPALEQAQHPAELKDRLTAINLTAREATHEYIVRSISNGVSVDIALGDYTKFTDWRVNIPLDSKHMDAARYRVAEALQYTVMCLTSKADVTLLLPEPSWRTSPDEHPLGPGITLL